MIEVLKLSDKVFNYYRNETNDNKNISREQAELKMTRNKHLALPYYNTSGRTWYAYGQLHFAVENNVVGWIENRRKQPAVWHKDWDKYDKITKQLSITDNRADKYKKNRII